MISMLNRDLDLLLLAAVRRGAVQPYHQNPRPIGLVVGIVLGVISVAHLGETFRLLAVTTRAMEKF